MPFCLWFWEVRTAATNLTINISDVDVRVLEVKAKAQGLTVEEYALRVI